MPDPVAPLALPARHAPDDATDAPPEQAKAASLRALSLLNFFVSDVQTGMGPYLTLYLRSSVGWSSVQIGRAITAGYLTLVISQVPAGAWIDGTRRKRTLIVFAASLVAVACLGTAFVARALVVDGGQALLGVSGAILPPCIAAISLGLVGHRRLAPRQGLNQAWNAGGNVAAAVVTGLVGQFIGLRWMFAVLALFVAGAIASVLRIRPDEIDYAASRGAAPEADAAVEEPSQSGSPGLARRIAGDFAGLALILRKRDILVFTAAALLLNLSNGAMAPLVTQQIAAQRNSHYAALWVGGFMIAVQSVYLLVAARAGRLADAWGRKPLYTLAYAAVAARGVLLTWAHTPAELVAVQAADGVVAGIASVVSILIIADLTQGTGRFNIAQGAFAAAQGLGAAGSNFVSSKFYTALGPSPTFLILAGVAAAGAVFFWLAMPETRDRQASGIGGGAAQAPAG